MSQHIIPFPSQQNASPFDAIRQVRPDGSEFWSARDLMPLLGYGKWQSFRQAIDRTSEALQTSDVLRDVEYWLVEISIPTVGCPREDFELDRLAAHLLAMNCDKRKPEVQAVLCYLAALAAWMDEGQTRPRPRYQPFPPESLKSESTSSARMRKTRAQRRRAERLGLFVEDVIPSVVLDRDKGMCGLCGNRIDPSLMYPHPKSFSLDHRIPLASGGKHEYSNAQSAHLSCNLSKGDRRGNVFAAHEWAQLLGLSVTKLDLHRLGVSAAAIGRRRGLENCKIPDDRYGSVNGWPLWIWNEAHNALKTDSSTA